LSGTADRLEGDHAAGHAATTWSVTSTWPGAAVAKVPARTKGPDAFALAIGVRVGHRPSSTGSMRGRGDVIMGIDPHEGTAADEPVEPPGAPGDGDPTVELNRPVAGQRTRAFEQLPGEEDPAAEEPVAAEPPGNRDRRTEQFAPLVDAPGTAQAPAWSPPAGPPRRRPGIGVLVGVAAAIVALAAVAALALPSLTGGKRATTAATGATGATGATAATPTTAGAPTQTTIASATTQAGAVAGTVQVVRSGFTQLPPEPDGDAHVSYAVVLRNPRNDQVALNLRAIMTFTAGNGAVVETKDEELDALLPGQTAAVADTTGARGVKRMRVQLFVGGFAPAQGLTGNLSASGARTSLVAGELVTTATVRSTLGRPLSGADVVAVYYDRSGRIIGGQSDSVDVVPAGGAVPARLDTSHVLPGIARTEVHASPKDLVPGG
jgi:hypothetical protein